VWLGRVENSFVKFIQEKFIQEMEGSPMATVRVVVNFRVKPGKEPDLLEGLRAVKKHQDRSGAGMFVVRQAFGPEAGNVAAVGQYSGWEAFAKVHSDPEFAQLLAKMRSDANPAWEALAAAVNEEVTL
jgi:hypothetical protein